MKVLSLKKVKKILILLIVIAVALEVLRYNNLAKPSSWIHSYTRRFSSNFFKNSDTLFDDGVTETFEASDFKIHDNLAFTAFVPRQLNKPDLIHRLAELNTFLDKAPNSQLMDIGVRSGVLSIAAAVKGRRVVSVPIDRSSARRLRKAAQVNKVADRIAIVKNPIHGVNNSLSQDLPTIEFDDLLTVVRFREALILLDLDKYELSSFHRLENLIRSLNVSAIVTKWQKNIKWNDPIASLLARLTFHPYSSLVGHSKLGNNSSLWPDYVVWKYSSINSGIVNIYPVTGHKDEDLPSGILSTYKHKRIKIFTYYMNDVISRYILTGRSWEYRIIAPLQKYMERDPDLQFIDIGANIGTYSLSVAIMGRKVIAVDANHANLLRFAQSARANGLSDRVVLVNNAVDANHSTVYLGLVEGNIGGSPISNDETNIRVNAITGDDLLKVIDFKRAVLKIDIEGHEARMLMSSSKLFEKVDIPLILFEWAKNRPEDARMINEFFLKRDYVPFRTIDSRQPLPADYNTWPWDIVWKRSTTANLLTIASKALR